MIGAGSSGIAAVKALAERGIPFDCFEKSDRVGGNWVFRNANGMSSAYWSLHINTSRDRMAYSDFPMPADYPDFPHHTQVAAYFDAYVDHFGLREKITFETGVAKAEPHAGGWRVTLESGEERDYRALLIANGHHWDPRWPEPAFPGADTFAGVQMHSHHYTGDDPELLRDKRVVVLGMGNSAMDIAVEATQTAERVFLAARRGAWIVPKYVFGRPLDQFVTAPRIPLKIRQRFMATTLRAAIGDMERYGLPKPDHRVLEAHPTISDTILTRLTHGDITPKPNIARLTRDSVVFADGSEERADVVDLRHRLQGQLPVLRPRPRLRARQRAGALQARLPSRSARPVLPRAAAAARRDDAARRGAVAMDLRPPDGRLHAPAQGRAARRHRPRARGAAPPVRGEQAPHDAGRLRRLPL